MKLEILRDGHLQEFQYGKNTLCHNKQLDEGTAMYEVRGTYSTNVQIPRKFLFSVWLW